MTLLNDFRETSYEPLSRGSYEVIGSFWQHLEELCSTLRACLILILIGWVICFSFSGELLPLLYLPLSALSEAPSLVLLSPLDALTITSQLSFWVSMSVTSPIWGWWVLKFLLPAFYKEERIKLRVFIGASALMLAISGYLAWGVTLPLFNRFLMGWSTTLGAPLWSLSAYMDYALTLLFGHLIAGQMCLILLLCVHHTWISPQTLCQARKPMIIAILVISALLTPPDIFTQIMLAIPLYGLYEMAIAYAKWRAWMKGLVISQEVACNSIAS